MASIPFLLILSRVLVFVGSVAGLAVSLRHTILLMLPSGRTPHGVVAPLQVPSISLRSIVLAAPCVVFGGGRRALFLGFVPRPRRSLLFPFAPAGVGGGPDLALRV